MQFGVFSVSDIASDPLSGHKPTHTERISDMVRIAQHAEAAGLDVFGLEERHNPPYFGSSPAALLAYIGAKTESIHLSTTSSPVNDPVKLAEDYGTLQNLLEGRIDVVFGKNLGDSVPLALENYHLLRRLWSEENINWSGRFHSPLSHFTTVPQPLSQGAPFIWHSAVRSPHAIEIAAFYGDGFFCEQTFCLPQRTEEVLSSYRQKYAYYGHGEPHEAIVGLSGQIFVHDRSQDALNGFRPYFSNSQFYRDSKSLEDLVESTSISVGSVQQAIDSILSFREHFGDYQRQMFMVDHSGLPLKTVLEQIDYLGEQIVPVLRKELDAQRSPQAPSIPPDHAKVPPQQKTSVNHIPDTVLSSNQKRHTSKIPPPYEPHDYAIV